MRSRWTGCFTSESPIVRRQSQRSEGQNCERDAEAITLGKSVRSGHFLPETLHGEGGCSHFLETCPASHLEEPDAEPKKGIKSFRTIALTAIMSRWYVTCVTLHMEEEEELGESEQLHVGGIVGINCQHLQVMMTTATTETFAMARTYRWPLLLCM